MQCKNRNFPIYFVWYLTVVKKENYVLVAEFEIFFNLAFAKSLDFVQASWGATSHNSPLILYAATQAVIISIIIDVRFVLKRQRKGLPLRPTIYNEP